MIPFSAPGGVSRDVSRHEPSPRRTLESPPVSTVNNSEHERRDVRNTAVLWGMCLTGVSSYYTLLHPLNLPWPAPQRHRPAALTAPVGRTPSRWLTDADLPETHKWLFFFFVPSRTHGMRTVKDPRKSFTGRSESVVRLLGNALVGFRLGLFYHPSHLGHTVYCEKYCSICRARSQNVS